MSNNHGVALVTGAAKRIGRAIAEDLATHGFDVAVHHNASRKEAEDVVRRIESRGGRACAVAADLADMDKTANLIASAEAALGPVRLLVNNASSFIDDDAGQPDWTIWERHFALHLKAPVLLAGRMFSALPDEADGLVVNIVDQRVLRLNPRFFSYTLSKAALWTATQTMAQAYAPRLRVNAIGPGPSLANERQSPDDFQQQTDNVPLRRGPGLDEFGRTIRYLWEARSVTGQMIAVDGGQHLAWQTPDILDVVE